MHYNQILAPWAMQSCLKEKVDLHAFETLP